jgi:6-pyruvoyltetrahydropterin/6-carboxytetrahydropterin synthase
MSDDCDDEWNYFPEIERYNLDNLTMIVYVTRKVHFNAAHRMHNPKWSDNQNKSVFGLCNNPNWHGHNYELEVTVCGEPDPDTGYVVDLGKLKDIIEERVLQKMDHKNLNLDVDFLQGIIPSAENIATAIWHQLVDHIPSGRLFAVKLYETPRNFVEVRG